MKIERQEPSKSGDIIQSAWLIKLEKEKLQEGYFFFPENHAEILLTLSGTFQRKIVGYRKAHTLTAGMTALTKTRNRGMVLQGDGPISFILLKLQPQYLHIFSENQAFRGTDDFIPLRIPAKYNLDWREAMEQRDHHTLVSLLDTYIYELYREGSFPLDKIIQNTIELIQERKGEIKIKELNEVLGICKSTLEQKFNRGIGISPKEFCKIEKFGHFLRNYQAYNSEKTLTELTFMSGYYDQSHLIKDFKYYVDESPKRFLSQANKILLYA